MLFRIRCFRLSEWGEVVWYLQYWITKTVKKMERRTELWLL